MEILVFKTNISKKGVRKMKEILNQIEEINYWNIDLDDCDRVLRVETHSFLSNDIIQLVKNTGFVCEELNY